MNIYKAYCVIGESGKFYGYEMSANNVNEVIFEICAAHLHEEIMEIKIWLIHKDASKLFIPKKDRNDL